MSSSVAAWRCCWLSDALHQASTPARFQHRADRRLSVKPNRGEDAIASVAGFISRSQDGDGIGRACYWAVDFASVNSAPLEKFIWVHDDLFGKITAILMIFECGLCASEPIVVIVCEIGTDGTSSRPVLFSIPSDCPSSNLHYLCSEHPG
jgi:hypothetical protein